MQQQVASPTDIDETRRALNACPIGVAIIDSGTRRRRFVNAALVDIFDAESTAHLLESDVRETWVDEAEQDRIFRLFEEGQDIKNFEAERRTLKGRPIWLLLNSQEIWFQKAPARLVWHIDITDRKAADSAVAESQAELNRQITELRDREERLEAQARSLAELAEDQAELQEELQRLNQSKDKFFSIIAHDLRSPFNALLGFTELLRAGARHMNRDVLAGYSNSVHDAAEQTFKLMENLLHWSRLQMDQVSVDIVELDVAAALLSIIELMEPVAAGKEVDLVLERKGPAMAQADKDMVSTILRNLISNAIKFTPAGGTVTAVAERIGGECHITIVDTGVGVTEEKLLKLLRVDEKTSSTGTAGEIGTGLGLPLCAELVWKLGGSLILDSEPDEGMTAKVILPAADPD